MATFWQAPILSDPLLQAEAPPRLCVQREQFQSLLRTTLPAPLPAPHDEAGPAVQITIFRRDEQRDMLRRVPRTSHPKHAQPFDSGAVIDAPPFPCPFAARVGVGATDLRRLETVLTLVIAMLSKQNRSGNSCPRPRGSTLLPGETCTVGRLPSRSLPVCANHGYIDTERGDLLVDPPSH